MIGLPVDDHETVRRSVEQIDVALDEMVADRCGDPEFAPELAAAGLLRKLGFDGLSGESRNDVGAADDTFCRSLRCCGSLESFASGKVHDLQHGVDGAPNGCSVAALLPRWQIEISCPLVETGIAGLGRLASQGGG